MRSLEIINDQVIFPSGKELTLFTGDEMLEYCNKNINPELNVADWNDEMSNTFTNLNHWYCLSYEYQELDYEETDKLDGFLF